MTTYCSLCDRLYLDIFFFKSMNIPQPNSLLSMDLQIDSVFEIIACMVKDFSLKQNRSGQSILKCSK